MAGTSAKISVNTDSMRKTHQKAAEAHAILTEKLKSMSQSVAELNLTWSGGNKEEFEAEFNRRMGAITNTVNSLEAYLAKFAESAKAYEATEGAVSLLVNR